MREKGKKRGSKKMKWSVLFTLEREVILVADNLNEVVRKANSEKATEEKITSIKIRR